MAEPRRPCSVKGGELKGARILVVEARFYDDIADALLAGAKRALHKAGAAFDRVTRARRARNSAPPLRWRSTPPKRQQAL